MIVFLMPAIASAASEKFMEVKFGSKGNVSAENIQVYTKTAPQENPIQILPEKHGLLLILIITTIYGHI